MKKRSLRQRRPAWWPGDESLVCACGDVVYAKVEEAVRSELVDHVWIRLDSGMGVPIETSINTWSLKNEEAGFDPRIRAGVVRGGWESLPLRGVQPMRKGFDYAHVEAAENVYYEHLDRSEMEDLLVSKATHCLKMEVWGMPYQRPRPGIHQIHSRRASCAVSTDIIGSDGGIKFYFADHRTTEMWLFKFCGQP